MIPKASKFSKLPKIHKSPQWPEWTTFLCDSQGVVSLFPFPDSKLVVSWRPLHRRRCGWLSFLLLVLLLPRFLMFLKAPKTPRDLKLPRILKVPDVLGRWVSLVPSLREHVSLQYWCRCIGCKRKCCAQKSKSPYVRHLESQIRTYRWDLEHS